MQAPELLQPDWPLPADVHAVTTLRRGGFSSAPFDGFNLADHVGDDADMVSRNRARLRELCGLPGEPAWLNQVHGLRVVDAARERSVEADGSWSGQAGVVCAVLTADCLPILLCDRAGRRIAALHAGWRGLAGGIVESGIAAMGVNPDRLTAWCGPAIGPRAFEVGDEVRSAFIAGDAGAGVAFSATRSGHWLADLYRLARRRLAQAGVDEVHGAFDRCTWSEPEAFFSYRRDRHCGRMATLIWRTG